ncbi:MAG: hypothetical protein RR216_00100 [Pseudoflavonifractor sp.]
MRKEVLRMDHVVLLENRQPLLNDLSIQVFEGEIYGVLGLERHGGAELFRLVAWNDPIQSGHVFFRERLVNDGETGDGSRNKVAVIDGSSRLIESLSLADNLFVIRPGFRQFVIHERVLEEQTEQLLQKYGICLPCSVKVEELKPYERIVAELLRAVVAGERLVILMDIPDLLGSEELMEFHRLLQKMTGFGMTFLYVYNHHETLQKICDRIAIFKKGRVEKVVEPTDSLSEHVRIFARPAYERLSQLAESKVAPGRDTVLQLDRVNWGGLRQFSMSIRSGETVLLIDHNNNAVLDDLMDLFRTLNRRQAIPGVVAQKAPGELRIGILPRAPARTTLFPDMSFLDNLCFALGEKIPGIWSKRRLRNSVALEFREELGDLLEEKQLYALHSQDLYTLAYYRYLIAKPDLVVCIQPISGLDMYLRPHILRLITRLRDSGIPVLVLSSNLYDTLYVADRVLWVEDGKVTLERERDRFQDIRLLQKDLFPD